MLGEGPTYGINGTLVQQRKGLALTLAKQRQNFLEFTLQSR